MAKWPYNTKQWKALRETILLRDLYQCQWPRCGVLLKTGAEYLSDPHLGVVDHKLKVDDRPDLAFDPDNLQSLCKHHHDSAKQSQERKGYDDTIGKDGWPIDPRHPTNRSDTQYDKT